MDVDGEEASDHNDSYDSFAEYEDDSGDNWDEKDMDLPRLN